ncbi:hypothetical protein ALC53_09549 [Atta colombica]|uniref:Uncharacterized protein n=1 Tax=Atta colombica TaxID=520822 RepID=A0A195B679_9HYME|nr:PREDICTED: probable serine/threonine-protein kinase mkcC [Atta colombica]KYM80023.1 hypothetical protein ALC53_09549 [Atta colombica]
MSPRRTRAATAEQSVSTRSKTQKVKVSQNVAKSAQKIRQSQKKRKSNVENNLETAAKQSAKKEVPKPDLKITFKKSTKKKSIRRKLNLNKETDTSVLQEDQNMDLSESIRILRDKHCNNIATMEFKTNLFQYNASNRNSEKMLNKKLQRNISITNAKISPVIVTPKSTPPKLSLTPHRSKKTPKKSPISIGSPKTHSITVPKLFKSPRKLSLVVDEDSEESLEKSESDSYNKKSRKSKKNTLDNNSKSNKIASTSSATKNNRKKSSLNLISRKFSKSPKIMLKSPKSKKSKSHKLKLLSSSRREKNPFSASPNTTPNLENDKSSKISSKKSPLSKEKNLSSIKNPKLSPKLTKILTVSQMKDVLAEPVVVLDKLSSKNVKQKHVVASKTRNTSIKIKSPSNERNLKVIIIPVEDHVSGGTSKRNSNSELRSNSMGIPRITTNTNRTSRIKYNALIQGKAPLVSSTPREEHMISRNNSLSDSIGSVNNISLNTRSRYKNQSIILANTMDRNTDIENISSPSLFDDKDINNTLEISQFPLVNVTKLNITYDKDNSKKQENHTYELEQPQTLNLRQMISRKRSSADANLSVLKDNVKKAKVRFVDISSNANSSRNSINKLNGSRSSISHNTNAQHRNNVMNSTQRSKKTETAKFIRSSLISPFKNSNPRIHRDTSIQLNAIQTPKTFASVEKKSEKKSSLKKVPNFGRIHEQMFAKSESLVDAKKRLEARHLAFTANQSFSKDRKSEQKKPLPSDTKDGIHNRFGFKLKKSEATHLILKKQTVFSRQKQQHEMRMMLKGVRTNRRFELQMKSRNINS